MRWLRRILPGASFDASVRPAFSPLSKDVAIEVLSIDELIDRGYRAKDENHHDLAIKIFDQGLQRDPSNCSLLNALGLVYRDLAQADSALNYFAQALAINPHHLGSLCNSATLLVELGRSQEAIRNCELALSIEPGFEPALSALALAYISVGRHREALQICDGLVARFPDRISLRRNRALTLHELGRFKEALDDFRLIVELDPSNPEARYSLAFNALLCGDFATGWPMHEARLEMTDVLPLSLDLPNLGPAWDGRRSLQGKTILLYGEQGFGDVIQFSRYCRLVKAQGARVLLGVPAPLRSLFTQLEGVDELLPDNQALPHVDEHCALMSLPLAFGTQLDSIPELGRPLLPSPQTRELWHPRLGDAHCPRIAVAWRGNPKQHENARRSIGLDEFSALFRLPFEFVSMQLDLSHSEREILARHANVRECGSQIRDFDDSAAIFAACDLVISVCSAPAHLAGAMAKPCWLLLSDRADWRWLLDRSDTPWYPTTRLFRQSQAQDWRGVIQIVEFELAKML